MIRVLFKNETKSHVNYDLVGADLCVRPNIDEFMDASRYDSDIDDLIRGSHTMDTTTLKQILLEELNKYTGEGLNDDAYLMTNEAETDFFDH